MKNTELLVAVVCVPIAFIVGVLAARIFPEGLHVEWGSVADWFVGFGTLATAAIAWTAFTSWREQLRGQSSHDAAKEIAEAAASLRYAFYEARSPMYMVWEFPDEYNLATHRDREQEAKGYTHVFKNRFAFLQPEILRIAKLRANAGALLIDEVAEAMERLARKARELHNLFGHRVNQIRNGPELVPDTEFSRRVSTGVEVDSDHADAYSIEFESLYRELKALLAPFI